MAKIDTLKIGETYRFSSGRGYGKTKDRNFYGIYTGETPLCTNPNHRSWESEKFTRGARFQVVGQVGGMARPIVESAPYFNKEFVLDAKCYDTDPFDVDAFNVARQEAADNQAKRAEEARRGAELLVPWVKDLVARLGDDIPLSLKGFVVGGFPSAPLDDEEVMEEILRYFSHKRFSLHDIHTILTTLEKE